MTSAPPPLSRFGADLPAPDPVLAAEAERDRLADRLHTGLLQSLVVVRHAIARERGSGAPSAGAGLPTADEALGECLVDTRLLVWHLRSRTAGATLAEALDDLAHRLETDGAAALVVTISPAASMTPAQDALVYRVVQAVCLATGPAAELEVAVTVEDGRPVVRVRGPVATVEADPEVREWSERAAAYRVVVELVTA